MGGTYQKADNLVDQGLQLYSQGQLDEALSKWDSALQLISDHPRALEYLKYVKENRQSLEKRFKKAASREVAAVKVEPDEPQSAPVKPAGATIIGMGDAAPPDMGADSEVSAQEVDRLAQFINDAESAEPVAEQGDVGLTEAEVQAIAAEKGDSLAKDAFSPGLDLSGPRAPNAEEDDAGLEWVEDDKSAGGLEWTEEPPDAVESGLEWTEAAAGEKPAPQPEAAPPEDPVLAPTMLDLAPAESDLDLAAPEAGLDISGTAAGPPDPSLSEIAGDAIELGTGDYSAIEVDNGEEAAEEDGYQGLDLQPPDGGEELDDQEDKFTWEGGFDLGGAAADDGTPAKPDVMSEMIGDDQAHAFEETEATPSKAWSAEDVERLTFAEPDKAPDKSSDDVVEEPSQSLEEAQACFDKGQLEESLEICQQLLEVDPLNDAATRLLDQTRESLLKNYWNEIGDLTTVPTVIVPQNEIVWQRMNNRAGFLLSRIDGMLTYEDIIDVSGMDDFEVTRILIQLIREGIIGVL